MTGKTDSKERVYQYLKSQNRPYSANDIIQNLHNEFGKAAVQKALEDLSREDKIREKIYGKQKVYSVLQEEKNDSGNMETELLELDSRIEAVSASLKAAESELKANENTLKELGKQPSRKECLKEKVELERDIEKLRDEFENLPELDVNVFEKEREKIGKDNEMYLKEYRKRKRICMDILNTILENCSKPKKALIEEIGIETDEEIGFKIPSCFVTLKK